MTKYDRPDTYFDKWLDFLIKKYNANSLLDFSSTQDRSMQESFEAGHDENWQSYCKMAKAAGFTRHCSGEGLKENDSAGIP